MPKKQNHKAHVSRALVAAMIGVIAVPTAMTGLFQSIDDDGINAVPVQDLRYRALRDAPRVRQLRRDYWQAIDIYNETERLGIENIGPIGDVNDTERIQYYLNPDNFSAYENMSGVHAAAGDDSEKKALISQTTREYNALPEMYRDLMDGYITTGRCPGTLRQFHLAGFYDLCQRMLEQHLDAVSPAFNFATKSLDGFLRLENAPLRNLRNRLEVMEESLLYEGGTSVRPRTHNRVSRPRLDYRSLRTGRQ